METDLNYTQTISVVELAEENTRMRAVLTRIDDLGCEHMPPHCDDPGDGKSEGEWCASCIAHQFLHVVPRGRDYTYPGMEQQQETAT